MHSALRFAVAIGAAAFVWASPAAAGCSKGPFSGAYVGGTLGGAWLHADQHPIGETKINKTDEGLAGGVLAGYGWQCDRWVLGVETDINLTSLETNATQTGSYYRTTLDWLGSVRGRLGTTIRKDVLLYGTAGLAYAERAHRFEDNTLTAFVDTQKGWDTGFVYGGGIEMLRANRFLLRIEGLFVDLGKTHHDYRITYTSSCGSPPCTATTSSDWKDSFFVARVGLSVKLGDPEPVYKPLK
ncbi:MAG: outer membrane beta-barrel protein [Hyphomicrobiaceae bacterium]|nr:outer membrane beta-barrel protein [Hyphomicrobiaceae bacterium]